jgi:hypothetical protein
MEEGGNNDPLPIIMFEQNTIVSRGGARGGDKKPE